MAKVTGVCHQKVSFLFLFHRHVHRSPFWTHPRRKHVITRGFCQGSAFWGPKAKNSNFTPFCPKTPKLALLAGANGKLRAHNSGTESGIHFKPGSSNDHMTAVISQHSKTAKIEIFA